MTDKVIFRKFSDGDVIALFPEIKGYAQFIQSYMHIGQHGDASRELIKSLSIPHPDEYKPLLDELTSIGYKLKVVK
jgi:hypothetical protein